LLGTLYADLDFTIYTKAFPLPVIFDCHVDQAENCFPMIPSGKPHNQMLLGPKDQEENKITGKGKALV
jgi:acetolactate synthase-1/2/3 large subunit